MSSCIFREMRGSLIAPMVAHSVNNAVTMTLGFMIMQPPSVDNSVAWLVALIP